MPPLAPAVLAQYGDQRQFLIRLIDQHRAALLAMPHRKQQLGYLSSLGPFEIAQDVVGAALQAGIAGRYSSRGLPRNRRAAAG